MKSIILKRHTIQGKVHRIALYLFGVCSNAFREGFRKGAAWSKKQSKNNPKQ